MLHVIVCFVNTHLSIKIRLVPNKKYYLYLNAKDKINIEPLRSKYCPKNPV